MMQVKIRRPILGVIALTGLLAACVAGPGAISSTAPSVSSGSAAAQPDPACFGVNESVDTAPSTVANLMPFSTTVVVAQVKSIEAGVWNTKDGKQPGQGVKNGPRFNPEVDTLINLQVNDTWIGDAGPGALRVVNPGGTAGCVEYHVSNAADVQKGNTYVFFLQPSPDADGQRHPELPLVLAAWPVDGSGIVGTAEEGSLTLAQVEQLVRHPVAPTPTPEPTSAGPG
jgi:hypothetical protein